MTRLRPLFPAAIAAATLLLAAASPAGAAAPWVTSDSLVGDPALQSGGVRAVADHAGNVFAAWVGQAEDLSLSIIARRRAAGSASWDAPQTITAEGVQFDDPAIVASPNGDITVAWSRNNGSTTKIETTTRSAATGAWSPVERMPDTPGSASDAQCDDPQLVVDGSGTLTMIWREWGGAVVAARRPDGGAWQTAQVISGGIASSVPVAAGAPDGSVAVFMRHDMGSTAGLTTYDPDTGWAAPQSVPVTGSPDLARIASDGNGHQAVVWFVNGSGIFVSQRTGDGPWSGPEAISPPEDVMVVTPDLTFLPGGDLLVAWTKGDPSTLVGMDFSTIHVGVSSRVFSDGAWEPVQTAIPVGPTGWAVPRMAARSDGRLVVASGGHGEGGMTAVGISVQDDPAGVWTTPVMFPGSAMVQMSVHAMTVDDEGNAIVVWDEQPASQRTAHVGIADLSGPRIGAIAAPDSPLAGETVTFGAAVSDTWSEVASVHWDFGDGGSSSGRSAGHAYAAPGTYTVTVTATDSVGNTSTRTRQVTVGAAPAADDDADDAPPVVIAPVIEARLAGKTLAVNAKVTLKRGQKCKGTITVTTAFGGKTYKVPAKLGLRNGACRATATIRLKKTPSLRTKLRVTVGATKADKKKIAARTITSRRG